MYQSLGVKILSIWLFEYLSTQKLESLILLMHQSLGVKILSIWLFEYLSTQKVVQQRVGLED
jgi:hypothetical protein